MGIFLKQSQMLDVSKVLVIQPITLTTLNRLRLLFAFFFFDQTTGSLPTVWTDLSLPVHVSVAVI